MKIGIDLDGVIFDSENEFDLIDLDDESNRFSQMLLKIGGLLQVG